MSENRQYHREKRMRWNFTDGARGTYDGQTAKGSKSPALQLQLCSSTVGVKKADFTPRASWETLDLVAGRVATVPSGGEEAWVSRQELPHQWAVAKCHLERKSFT